MSEKLDAQSSEAAARRAAALEEEGALSRDSHDVSEDEAFDDDGDLIELVRDRLALGDDISDVTIASSLAAIGAKGDARSRWLVAFSSPLGRCLAMRGTDLNTALSIVLAIAPKPVA